MTTNEAAKHMIRVWTSKRDIVIDNFMSRSIGPKEFMDRSKEYNTKIRAVQQVLNLVTNEHHGELK
jgi:hypothetical protein